MLKYDAISFEKEFPKTILGNSIIKETPQWVQLLWEQEVGNLYITQPTHSISEKFTLNNTPTVLPKRIFLHLNIFWYINFLLEKSPTQITDIGCGDNLYKNWIPFIHGIDPVYKGADEIDFFDAQFSRGHTEAYESVMSINALHFISISNYGLRLREFANIIKPNGRGLITFNIENMSRATSDQEFDLLFGTNHPTEKQLSEYLLKETVSNLKNILVYDDYIAKGHDPTNGNIRIVFDK